MSHENVSEEENTTIIANNYPEKAKRGRPVGSKSSNASNDPNAKKLGRPVKYATEEERRAAIAAQKAKLNYKKPIYNKTYNEKHKEYFREYFQTKVKIPSQCPCCNKIYSKY
jgi:hypothetical protein